ncbi:WD40 repeat-like protein [Phlegmacium glaucopus]|nr:WD40 repeat-like protein [Phlegmacium glaucopus]
MNLVFNSLMVYVVPWFDSPRGRLSRDLLAHSSSRTPYDNKSFIREAMSSSSRGIGSTLTGGIQDIAPTTPQQLGTEQCEVQGHRMVISFIKKLGRKKVAQVTPTTLPLPQQTPTESCEIESGPSDNRRAGEADSALASASFECPKSPTNMQRSDVYAKIVDSSVSSEDSRRPVANAASAGLEGLKTTLRLIERATDVFTPLKSVVGGLLGVIDIMENRQDRADLGKRLEAVVSIINDHRYEANPSSLVHRLDGLSTAIGYETSAIQSQNNRGFAMQAAGGVADAAEIANSYRTISYLLDVFVMDTSLAVERTTQEILSHELFDKLPRAIYAAYDASSPTPRHECTKGTREAILASLLAWATDPTDTKIYWLNGAAGTGKTTIDYTFCQLLDRNGMLGATFFCSRSDDDSRNVKRIFPTLAYELARRFPSVSRALVDILRRDPDAGYRSLNLQFSNLIASPLQAASEDLAQRSIVIIIDALDECADQEVVYQMLSIILLQSPLLPVKFFISSRPERMIRRTFNPASTTYSVFLLHEANFVDEDIKLYIRDRLGSIAEQASEFEGAQNEWPPEDQLDTLVQRAAKLFIYAATACNYVGSGGSARERLNAVTRVQPTALKGDIAELDALYASILNAAYESLKAEAEEQKRFSQVLRAVISVYDRLLINDLALLLGIKCNQIRTSLSSLHSVIFVPREPSVPIAIFHASFPDFITNPDRAGENILDTFESHEFMALKCLDLMGQLLRENICYLEGRPRNVEIPISTIKEHIPGSLSYACLFWPSHVIDSTVGGNTEGNFYKALCQLFDNNILHWIECLSLLGRLDVGVDSLRRLERWAMGRSNLLNAIIDARRFIVENYDILKHSCLETYHFALQWLPDQSQIRQQYAARNCVAEIVIGRRQTWDACEAVLEGHSDYVWSASFSPDGSRVVSAASNDKIVRIWNAFTGEPEVVLEGHSDSVGSALFSPDGSRVVSASKDKTVRIWNAFTGELEAVFEGHSGPVSSAVFSPDGSHVVSGSYDKTVRLWNAVTGKSEAVLEGHIHQVLYVIFSPDGSRIVSGSSDRYIWNAVTHKVEAVLEGSCRPVAFSPDGGRLVTQAHYHDRVNTFLRNIIILNAETGKLEVAFDEFFDFRYTTVHVLSVVFSPDGSRVVSGSCDKLVRIWNASTGTLETVLKGHSSHVDSVNFSPDGSRIVSGSSDNTLRIWNVIGDSEDGLEKHSGFVSSAVFSPDGSRVVSGSEDKTVRLWNAVTGKSEVVLQGHSDSVKFVVFSPDGSNIVSGSDDATVRIWNAVTGKSEAVLKGHTSLVKLVVFSPDGSFIASGSDDNTVRIWNVVTGEPKGVLNGKFVVFSWDGSNVVVSGAHGDSTVYIWNVVTCKLKVELKGHSDYVPSATFSPDGSRVVSASNDMTVRIWNAVTGQSEAVLKIKPSYRVNSVTFFSDSVRAVARSRDGTACIWNSVTSDSTILEGHSHSVWTNRTVFSPSGSYFTSTSEGNAVLIWNTLTGKLEAALEGHSDSVQSARFSPDGSRIVSASNDKTVRIWNALTGKLEAVLEGHSGRVMSASFSSDSSRVVSGSDDKTVRIWNALTGESEAVLKGHSDSVSSVVFSPDGSHVVSGSFDRSVRIWNTVTGDFKFLAERVTLSDGSEVHHRPPACLTPSLGLQPPSKPHSLYSVSTDRHWILSSDVQKCWIPPRYRGYVAVDHHMAQLCLGYPSGEVLLLKLQHGLN